MAENKEGKKWNLGERLFRRFKKRIREKPEETPLNGPPEDKEASADFVHTSSISPAQTESVLSPQPEQGKHSSLQMGLWTRAADSLEPEDRERLEILIRSRRKSPNSHGRESVVDDVNSTLDWAQKLEKQGTEATCRAVANKIIKGVLAFKSVGDAAVAFDKSGYAALGWSVVSFGLQIAANVEEVREFVLSSSEVITQLMARYREYERDYRGPEGGENFDRLLTSVYKAILLYIMALDEYLDPQRLGRLQAGVLQPKDQSITLTKKAIDAADDLVQPWLAIIWQKRVDAYFRKLFEERKPNKKPNTLQECSRSLSFREMHQLSNEIERPAEGTCKWLLEHQNFREWADGSHSLLCIKGNPGSGKSTLLRYALDHAIVTSNIRGSCLRRHSEGLLESEEIATTPSKPDLLILSFFFHDRGTHLQKTPLGLFRSLLHQLLRLVPDATPDVLLTTFQDRKNNMGSQGAQWDWQLRELQDFFQLFLRKVLESHQVCLFIDAFDEYGEKNANNLIESFESWIQGGPSQANFRVCFTCRHFPALALPPGIAQIRLEKENERDISEYVQGKLSIWSGNEDLGTIWKDITNRASGIFMWARLMVPRVLELERKGENRTKIKNEILTTPIELKYLYRRLVKTVATEPASLKLITWICFAMEPLTLDELRWAMIVDPAYAERPASLRHCEENEGFATDCYMMKKKLKTLSCGLAEAVPSSRVVQFIHQSVKDFFMEEGLSTLRRSQNTTMNKNNEADLQGAAHYQLSRTCIRYFSAEEIMQSKLSGRELLSEFPLLRYATAKWIAHVQNSEETVSQTDLLDYFGWPSEAVLQLWQQIDSTILRIDSP